MTLGSYVIRTTPADAFDPCAESPVTRRFVEDLLGSSPFPALIHTADEMYRYNLSSLKGSRPCAAILYYSVGWQIFQTIRNVAGRHFGGLDRVASLLDFASGHGRVTRFLVGAGGLAPERIFVSEIHQEAVSFQKEYFQVGGIFSSADPSAFPRDRRFDLVIASSFFSHVPAPSFRAWMAALLGCVEQNGLLLFSTLSSDLLNDETRDWSDGMLFVPESETERLEKSSYGTAYVTEEFVRDAVRRANDSWNVIRFPRGFCGFQDLYVVASGGWVRARLEPLNFAVGEADLYKIQGTKLAIAGWLRAPEGSSRVQRVEFRVNHDLRSSCQPKEAEPDRYRWCFEADPRSIAPDDVLMIQAIHSKDLQSIVALGTLRTHPPERRE